MICLLRGLGGVAGPFPLCGVWRAAGGSVSIPVHTVIDYKPAGLCLDHGNEKGEEREAHVLYISVTGKAVSVVIAVVYCLQGGLLSRK